MFDQNPPTGLGVVDREVGVSDSAVPKLRAAVEGDLERLEALCRGVRQITPERDPKLKALVAALGAIAKQANDEAIRANRPADDDGLHINEALDILEAPWPRREELMLRDWFNSEGSTAVEKARTLVSHIRKTGLEPFNQPKLLPPIEEADIELICWMGVSAQET